VNIETLSELFGGTQRFKALRALFSQPERSFGLRELSAEAGVDSGNLSRWLKRWSDAGLVVRVADGLTRYQATPDPSFQPLVAFFRLHSELLSDLKSAVGKLNGVEAAAVYGSFARGTTHAGSDIDVLLVGSLSELKANAALRPLSRQYGRDFNATVFTSSDLRHLVRTGDSFVLEVLAQPTIALKGAVHDIANAG
jgi:hypothetical protein